MGGLPRPIVGLIGVHLPEIQHLTQNRSESQLLQWGRLSQARAGHRVCEQKEVQHAIIRLLLHHNFKHYVFGSWSVNVAALAVRFRLFMG